MIWNLPNLLTVIRLVIAILFIPIFFYEQANNLSNMISLFLYVFASVTDILDGYIARKYNMITEFGKIFDPIADKLLQFLVAICIAFFDPIFIYVAIFIFAKEFIMMMGTIKLYKDKIVVSANSFGKIASVVYFLLFYIMLGYREQIDEFVKMFILSIFFISSIIAFINYFIQYFKLKTKKMQKN